MMKIIAQLMFSLFLITTASCQEIRTVKTTITEEDGTPIAGASVTVTFLGYGAAKTTREKGQTDAQGLFEARGTTNGRMSVRVEKEGYYPTKSGRLSRKQDHDVKFVLRKKKNPIPLYAKRFHVSVPVKDKDVGYDLEIGDWVAPHGKGKQKDVIFNLSFKKEDFWTTDYKLKVSFPNEKDGIQQFKRKTYSKLQSPYVSPEKGYLNTWTQVATRKGKESKTIRNTDFYRGHWMRVRTEVDDQGNVISANYVKVYGDFPGISYYFNPTPNDRNLEFDPQKNLFQNLDSTEQVREP